MAFYYEMSELNTKIDRRPRTVFGRQKFKIGEKKYVFESQKGSVSLFRWKTLKKNRKVIPFKTLIELIEGHTFLDFMGTIYKKKP